MKRIIKNIIFVFCIIGSSACSDVLDKEPLDKFSENDVWQSAELAQAFNYTTLKNATDKLIWNDQWTDNSVIHDDGGSTNLNKEQIDRYHDAGWNIYGDIRRCNLVLDKMKNNTAIMENDKNHFIAQAKMMRAMIYFSRARLFGKLMIVDRILDPTEEMDFPRTKTIKETYDFIIKDLVEAASVLPVELNSKQGMLVKGAAYALLAEVALHGAAYIENGQNEYYTIAQKASEDLFALSKYELDNDYRNLFKNFDYSLASKEIILAQWRHENNTTFAGTWMQSLCPNTNNDKNNPEAFPKLNDDLQGWPTTWPSVSLTNTYQVIDEDGKAKDWDETSYYKEYKTNGGYVSNAIYKNRDARFYATIVQDSTQYFSSIVTTREMGNLHWNTNIMSDWGVCKTGYIYRKCLYEDSYLWHDLPTFYHYVVLRLGRSYLNYAEVMLRLNQPQVAIEYINKTRIKHGGLPALESSLSLEETWKEYKRERRLELTMEGDRYWSLLRWGKADGLMTIPELNEVHQAISISADGKSFEFIPLPFKASDNIRVFTSKRYLLPVPQGERDLNPNLDQNTGW